MSKFVEWIVPPAGADAEAQRDWQWRIAVAIGGAYVMGTLLAMAAVGQLWGVSGFASARDFSEQKEMVKDIRLGQIRNQIDTMRVRQCQSIMEGNYYAMQLSVNSLQQLVNQHFVIAGFNYRIPDCSELIPGVTTQLRPETPAPNVRQ